MNNIFLENLDNALEDVQMQHVHYDNISQCLSKIHDLEDQLKDAKKELTNAIDKMCADLAVYIRQLNSNLKVSIKTNTCDVIYRTQLLSCIAKPEEGCWYFDTTDFGRGFSKRYPQCCRLSCPVDDLASCLVDHFRNSYRSLV